MKRRPSKPLRITVSILLTGTLLYTSIMREQRQLEQELKDRALIAGIKARSTQLILAALAEGASGEELDVEHFSYDPPSTPEAVPALLLLYRTTFESSQEVPRPGPDPRAVRALLNHGAQINDQDASGYSPLWYSVFYSDDESIRLLLKHGADVNAKDIHGCTPLMWADAKLTKLLLEHGANIEASSSHDGTPLIWAARLNKPDVVRILLEHGAKVTAKDANSKTALDHVRHDNDPDARKCAALLHNYGAK